MVTKKIINDDSAKSGAEVKAERKSAKKAVELTPEMANNLFKVEKQRYESLSNERNRVERFLLETEKTEFALKGLVESKSDDIMVNLGSGVYVSAKALDVSKVKYQTGTQVFLEKSADEVLKTLAERKTKLMSDLKELQKMEYQSQQNLNNLYTFLMKTSKQAHSHSHEHNEETEQ